SVRLPIRLAQLQVNKARFRYLVGCYSDLFFINVPINKGWVVPKNNTFDACREAVDSKKMTPANAPWSSTKIVGALFIAYIAPDEGNAELLPSSLNGLDVYLFHANSSC